ncbi:hypothetical protein KSF_087400 [Reticulibacter mediterranei]|uniref:Uncharacterized protein n=1 Tax=Reticulibacter mediterranei TaxID=2778369 RepID=A0A8J3N4X5_9CHLR|nr:hypothetical protein [Reticulibacter mediterranei]GHO98692.1 hypothetical protein KSF_087400 [Reticulibacter mediterranei]
MHTPSAVHQDSPYPIEQRIYGGYMILLLRHIHTIFLYDPETSTLHHFGTSKGEYTIMEQFVRAPCGSLLPFSAFAATTKESPLPLRRFIMRLRKKLPEGWAIPCTKSSSAMGGGYRLVPPRTRTGEPSFEQGAEAVGSVLLPPS